MGEERIRPEGSFRCELLRLGRELLERLPAEAVGARLRDALRDAAGRLRPCELLVVRGERGAAVLTLLLAAEERVRDIAEQRGADAGEEEAVHGSPGCRGQLMRVCSDGAVQFQHLLQGWGWRPVKGAARGSVQQPSMLQTSSRIMDDRGVKDRNWCKAPRSKLSRSVESG